jgi:hypothetical protein
MARRSSCRVRARLDNPAAAIARSLTNTFVGHPPVNLPGLHCRRTRRGIYRHAADELAARASRRTGACAHCRDIAIGLLRPTGSSRTPAHLVALQALELVRPGDETTNTRPRPQARQPENLRLACWKPNLPELACVSHWRVCPVQGADYEENPCCRSRYPRCVHVRRFRRQEDEAESRCGPRCRRTGFAISHDGPGECRRQSLVQEEPARLRDKEITSRRSPEPNPPLTPPSRWMAA